MNHINLFVTVITVMIVSVLLLGSEKANAALSLNGDVRLPSGVTTQDLDPTIRVIAYDAQMEIVDTFSVSADQDNPSATSATTVYSISNIDDNAKAHKYLLLIGCSKCNHLTDNNNHFKSGNFDYIFTATNSQTIFTPLANFSENFTATFQGTFFEGLARYIYLLGAMLVFVIKDFI